MIRTVEDGLFGLFAGSSADVTLIEHSDDDARDDGEQADHDADDEDEEPRLIDHLAASLHDRGVDHCNHVEPTSSHRLNAITLLSTLRVTEIVIDSRPTTTTKNHGSSTTSSTTASPPRYSIR